MKQVLGMLWREPEIYFVYGKRYQATGSTIMRGKQLSEIAHKILPSKPKIGYGPTTKTYRGKTLFLTKGAIEVLSRKELSALKDRKNNLIFDPVDASLLPEKAVYAHIIVAASETALKDFKKIFPKKTCMLVDHHPDPRIRKLNWRKQLKTLKIGYFGESVNAVITPKIKEYVDFIQVDTYRQKSSWLKKLPYYNVHYAIRNPEQANNQKPFLKGFNAAHCNANILVHIDQTDVVRWLGKDYPYLLRGPINEKNILKLINEVGKSYGSKEWINALEIMKKIKEQTSDEAIGHQLYKVFNKVGAKLN